MPGKALHHRFPRSPGTATKRSPLPWAIWCRPSLPARSHMHCDRLQVHDRLVKGASDSDKQFESLVFPEHAAPRVSIVIPAHNKFPVTYHCLSSLLLAGNKATFEVIVVDDGSKDETTDIPNLVKGIKYVRNDEAQGFIRACNLGGEQA